MRRILPDAARDVDVYDAYRPADPHADLLRLNMISSVEGTIVGEDGRSGSLAGAGDRELFRVLRALADGILVGAGTVRVEGYGPHRVRADLAERRRADGRELPAPLIVVSASLRLDFEAPLFTEAKVPTIVLTVEAADPERRRAAERTGRVLVAGEHAVDMVAGAAALRDLGLRHILCEGGPLLNTTLLAQGLVDEICLTVAPALVGPGTQLCGGLTERHELHLAAAHEQDGELFLRYRLSGG